MTEQITPDDIAGWSSLDTVFESFQKRGHVPREDLGEDLELVMGLADDRFISILAVSPTEDARPWNVPTNPFKVKYTLGRLPVFRRQSSLHGCCWQQHPINFI